MGLLVSKTSLGIATVAGAAFLGYCIYFDCKRRRQRDYKRKVYERRRREQERLELLEYEHTISQTEQAAQQYFMELIYASEQNFMEGQFEEGAENLVQAIRVCGKPEQLLDVLQESLPVEAFALLLRKLNSYRAHRESADNYIYFDQLLYQ